MHYPTHWRMAAVLALFFHLLVWLSVVFITPLWNRPAEAALSTQSLEWEEEGENGEDPVQETAELPPANQAVPAEKTETADVVPMKTEEAENSETTPLIAEDEKEAVEELRRSDAGEAAAEKRDIVIAPAGGSGVQMGTPPVLISDFYPADGLVSFRGRVSVFATIGKNGKVMKTKIAVTSGRDSVDDIAMSAVRRWTFKPALDQHGQPMECTKIISVPFNVPPRR